MMTNPGFKRGDIVTHCYFNVKYKVLDLLDAGVMVITKSSNEDKGGIMLYIPFSLLKAPVTEKALPGAIYQDIETKYLYVGCEDGTLALTGSVRFPFLPDGLTRITKLSELE